MEKHPIPKNIMDVEFKLFGALSMREFASLAVFIFFAVVVYTMDLPKIISTPLILIFIGLGIAFSFIRVNDLPFSHWISYFLLAVLTPQRRIWHKSTHVPKSLTMSLQVPKHTESKAHKTELTDVALENAIIENLEDTTNENELRIYENIERYLQDPNSPIIVNNTTQDAFESKNSSNPESQINQKVSLSTNQSTLPVDNNLKLKPNLIFGRILDKNDIPVANLGIVVKNNAGEISRQLVTGSNGVFKMLTPLPNGDYVIDAVILDPKQKFEPINLNLDGKGEKIVTIKLR